MYAGRTLYAVEILATRNEARVLLDFEVTGFFCFL
jgi:hypothetical protein